MPIIVHRIKKTTQLPNYSPGQVYILAILFMAVILILSASLFGRVTDFIRIGSNSIEKEQAQTLAESGVERALWKLNTTAGSFYGDTTEEEIGETGTSFVTIFDKSPTVKTITSTGYVGDSQDPEATRTIKVDAYTDSQVVSFNYAVQVGIGGLVMSNSSTINGNAYSNAVDAAYKSIQGYNSSIITGDALTVGTTSSPDPWVQGTKHPNQSPSTMPTVDYNFWKDKADDGGTITCSSQPTLCDLNSGTANIGPKKYVGNLYLSNTAIVNLQGPIWITGNIILSNSSRINLDASFGSNSTVIITDGTFSVSNSATINPTSASPKGYIMVVSTSTSNSAINIANSGSNAIIYALDGGAYLSNSAKSTALVTKRLEMSNSASFTYDNGLASTFFTTGPGASWQLQKGTYKFVSSP